MSISANIEAIQTRIQNDSGFAADFRRQAIEAIHAGINSEPWNTYMGHFVDDPATLSTPGQLARLTDDAADPSLAYLREARAYLLGNAICIPGTGTGLGQGIDLLLDD